MIQAVLEVSYPRDEISKVWIILGLTILGMKTPRDELS